jgi:TPR repeat protein
MAQWYVGMMLLHGSGVKQDEIRGVQWLRRAAEEGSHPPSSFLLLTIFFHPSIPQAFSLSPSVLPRAPFLSSYPKSS